MPRWPSSLRARLTLWYTLLLSVPLIVFAFGCYIAFERSLLSRTDRFVGDALTAFTRELQAERRLASNLQQAMVTTIAELRFRDLLIVIADTSWRIMASVPLPRDPNARAADVITPAQAVAALRTQNPRDSSALTLAAEPHAYRVVSLPVTMNDVPFVVTATYSLAENEGMLETIRRMFVFAIPLLVLCAATSGYFLAKRSLAPVSSMAARAAEISATNLHERLPVGGGVELIDLARVVNDLLDRLEASFSQQRRFMADASHELRTPTAIVRTEADVTLSRQHRNEEEYRASVTIMRDAARRLTRIVDDLFLLARADSGHPVARLESLYLEEVVHDAARSVRQVAEQRRVRVELRDVVEAPLKGDADLLGRLLLNLLDNAIKHAPEGGSVELGLTRENGTYRIDVVDDGPGIPRDAQGKVFERFFRAESESTPSANGATSGAGLGLAIARRIAEIHGGQLDLVESRPGHTRFRVSLPVAGA
jgi:heavy metal sensor kinase